MERLKRNSWATRTGIARRAALRGAAATALLMSLGRLAVAQEEQEAAPSDALTPVRDRYTALETYADTGTVLVEQQVDASAITESGTFTTLYRAPRNFFFEYLDDPDSGSDRLVIWCDGGDFQSWWATTNQHEIFDGGRGANAFFNAEYPTQGTSMAVPGLIFARADLGGPVAGLTDIREAGEEEFDGRSFSRIEADTIVAGSVVRPHPTVLLVDPQTLLLHKLVEDTPPDFVGLNRRTMTFVPDADVEVDDSRFSFTVPG
jgi:hypothetical protein